MATNNFYLKNKGGGLFEVWQGPLESESNFHWAKFFGLTNNTNKETWVMETSDKPDGLIPFPDGLDGPQP